MEKLRISEVTRKTLETDIRVKACLDGTGEAEIDTGVSFLDHMLTSLATHSLIDISAKATGDLKHHVVEDVSICLGEAIRKALGDDYNIRRFGYAIVPMDGSLAFAALDLARRTFSKIDLNLEGCIIEDLHCEDAKHFLETFSKSMQANVHINVQYGSNDHHKVEAAFKALAISLRQALSIDPKRTKAPSSKGVI